MAKIFNTTAVCIPEKHYMVNIDKRIENIKNLVDRENYNSFFTMKNLFELLSDFCAASSKPIVLIIDEVDSAVNNIVFFDFLAQLRAYYISVISSLHFNQLFFPVFMI